MINVVYQTYIEGIKIDSLLLCYGISTLLRPRYIDGPIPRFHPEKAFVPFFIFYFFS